MSQQDSGQPPHYSFGRDRHHDGGHRRDVQGGYYYSGNSGDPSGAVHRSGGAYQGGVYQGGVYQGGVYQDGAYQDEQRRAAGHYAPIPPPPAGYRGLGTVVLLYFAAGFMVLWTGATAAVTIEAMGGRDGEQFMIGLFMTVASLVITAGLGAWLIRIHRRRGSYRRILDQHYAQRFGHHPDG